MSFTVQFTTRWADFDANVHMRHTAYNDYAAEVRLRYFKKFDITTVDFAKETIGPIIFEENTKFLKEIHLGENITANLKVLALSNKGERWKVQHEIFNEAGKLSAIITVYGAWLDLKKRKLTVPPTRFYEAFATGEKTEDFQEIELKSK
ncbi:thioesterase [Tenacibaculum holothuriorum]|uniref:Thioesterase n=1 Tax=Tenacibaculum holothuriorum TaxID=1635173 RepID=A0A1Y2PAC1_9FLAO|nr:acyl-CoA thioesterase [Tenacibaculum holothuriorum]OSY87404.1 thioesterase [Tenacibaculum holothuriorum]